MVSPKRLVQRTIRGVHAALLDRGLPERVAVCGHDTVERHWPALRQMVGVFRERGYRFVDPDGFLHGPAPCVSLSFDDNFHSWYRALPLLEELGVTATFYLNTVAFRDRAPEPVVQAYFDHIEYHGDRRSLATHELREIAARGHTVGSHTHSHPVLTSLAEIAAREEIRRSMEVLEEILDEPVKHFAFPYGRRRHFDQGLREYCFSLGFETVANGMMGLQHAGHTREAINRTRWDFRQPPGYNLTNLTVDGRMFERLTGRCAVV